VSFGRALDRAFGSMDTWELVYLGLVVGVALMEWVQPDDPAPTRSTEQTVTLGEDDLRRLEDGDSLAVHRWHGHELHVRGDVVVDVPTSQDAAKEDADE